MAVPPGVESRRSEGQYQHGIAGHVTSSSVRSSTSESLPLSSIEVAINRAAARRCAKVARRSPMAQEMRYGTLRIGCRLVSQSTCESVALSQSAPVSKPAIDPGI